MRERCVLDAPFFCEKQNEKYYTTPIDIFADVVYNING